MYDCLGGWVMMEKGTVNLDCRQ